MRDDHPERGRVIDLKRAVDSPLGFVVVICLFVTLITQWVIRIPQAGLDTAFGFQVPLAWLVVIATGAALVATNLTLRLAAALAAEAMLSGWFAWAAWLASTSRFAGFEFPFMGVDLIAPGWFAAAIAVLATGATIAREFRDREPRAGTETWLLALIPGAGLIRLDRAARGAVYATLVWSAVFFAAIASPVGPLFQPVSGDFEAPPPPPTRALEWVFLGAAVAIALASWADTARVKAPARR